MKKRIYYWIKKQDSTSYNYYMVTKTAHVCVFL